MFTPEQPRVYLLFFLFDKGKYMQNIVYKSYNTCIVLKYFTLK